MHQRELEELEQRLDQEKNRQEMSLKDKLAARKQKRLEEHRRRQEKEIHREVKEMEKEREDMKTKQIKEAEKSAMITGIQENSIEAADIVIKKVLSQRHAKEIEKVDKEFELEMKEAVDDAVAALMEGRDRERDELVARHEQALQDLMAEVDTLSADELEEKRRELINEQQVELSKLEQSYARQKQQIEKGTAAELTLNHAKAKLELKEKHYQEFVSALNELTPENSTSRQRSVEQARMAAAELEQVKRRLEEQRKENERKLEEEKQGSLIVDFHGVLTSSVTSLLFGSF